METLPGGFEVASRPALGTTAQVVLHGKHVGPAALRAMDGLLDDLDLEASRFRQDSELSRVNASSSPELEVSPGFAALLEPALEWARRTHGLLDPTVGRAVVNAGYTGDFVGLERDQSGPAPGKSPAPGWWQVELSGTHLRRPPGVVLDLGSTSKAQVADRAAAELLALSGAAVLVSLGGDLATAGAIPPGGWVVRVGDDHQGRMGAEGQTVVLTARALATSSRAVRQWRRGGEPMHHLIDPRRG
ncbi:MAG: FAD:protein FMN transferase, partial [Candidatus Dormiibacterota bacterium]